MNDQASTPAREAGLRGSLARLAKSLVALLSTRAELAVVELKESRAFAARQALLVTVGVIAIALAWLALCVLVVVWLWDTHRLGVLAALTIVHLLVGIGALWRAQVERAVAPAPFAASLTELERDRQWLSEQFGSRE